MRQDANVHARIASLSATDRLAICTIVRGEVLFGLERMSSGRKRRQIESAAQVLFAQTLCEPIPEQAADIYARIKRDSE